MKEYRGTEIIKASRWIQDMSHEREVLEKIIPLTKVQVEDRSAKVFFEGEHDGKLLTVIVTVYKAISRHNQYFATTDGRMINIEDTRDGFQDFMRWINSICKLDTEEAKNGTLEMRKEEWGIVHADFIKEFTKKLRCFVDKGDKVLYGIMEPWQKDHSCILCKHYFPILKYDPDLHDFKKEYGVANDTAEVGFQVSYDAKKIYLVFGLNQYTAPRPFEFLKQMFPDSVPAIPSLACNGRDGSARMIECNSIDEAAEKMKYAQSVWDKRYDDLAKENGITRDWRKAKEWDWDGPKYEEGTPEYESLEADRKVKEAKKGVAVMEETLRAMTARGFDLKTMFPEAEITYEKGEVVVKIPYMFPKVTGSKMKWKPATCDISIEFYRDNKKQEEFRVKVQEIATYQTMAGVYDRFKYAKENDAEKMMMIKPCRARHKYWYYDWYYNARQSMHEMRDAIMSIRPKIDELKEFVEYKGFKE